ncbi:DNA-binding protein WhiA [Nakamurella silvestris]|nr:DNA-binding protein WhiA [Nakamurella silvestris]
MTIDTEVRDELARAAVPRTSARRAEVSTLLRFCAEIRQVASRMIVQAEFSSRVVARRASHEITALYGHPSELREIAGRHLLRISTGGESLARQVGLLDQRGVLVRGLPAQLITGSLDDAEAIWRGAVLSRGSLTPPGRAARLEVTSPSPEVSMALVGLARRLGHPAKARSAHGCEQVVVQGTDAVVALLTRLGAARSARAWQERHVKRSAPAPAASAANFNDANRHRMAEAAANTSARVRYALELVGETAPAHLIEAGLLRLAHCEASLESLGKLATPPMSKDSIAGRLRRLLSLADKHARVTGVPETSDRCFF